MSISAQSNGVELLTFQLSDQEYAIDIMSVREIRSWTRATSLPHSPDYIKGVINLRGTVLPVMDLAERLGLLAHQKLIRSVVIVVWQNEPSTGLLVDAVSDIVTLTPGELQLPPEMAMSDKSTGSMIGRLTVINDKMIRVLDLNHVVGRAQCSAA